MIELRSKMRALTIALFTLAGAWSAAAAQVHTPHLDLELSAQGTAVPGGKVFVALKQVIAPGWHTYWRNPGDAGEATQIDWTLPQGWSAGNIVWPTPERAVTGPLMNYVYSSSVILPVPLKVAADAPIGSTANLTAHASFLVCKDVCVPEEATLSVAVPVTAKSTPDPVWGPLISGVVHASPHPVGATASFIVAADGLHLTISGAAAKSAVKAAGLGDAYFYPFAGAVIDQVKPQKAVATSDGLSLILPAGYDIQHGKTPARLEGVLALGKGHAFELSAVQSGPVGSGPGPQGAVKPEAAPQPPAIIPAGPIASSAASAPNPTPVASNPPPAPAKPVNPDGLTLPVAMLLAVLGGLILNLMPCVFPVLSMKAAALARHTEHPAAARAEGIAYALGVIGSFVGLAVALIAARGAGEAVGWGFQLQSPLTVSVLTLVMLASALNLSGLFEMGLSAQGAGQGLAAKGGLSGAFFTGVLAVVVAAPCTGPFMASTIGWALAQPTALALLVFAALGLGLALPFLALAFMPGLYRVMPRPGPWMEGLRRFLAFPMYGAAAWLAWVFVEETSANQLPYLFAAALALAFGLWLWGVGQRSATDRMRLVSHLSAALAMAASAAVLIAVPPVATVQADAPNRADLHGVQPWSPRRVAQLQSEGRPIFVDFTAAWCVTCKVNEAGALATSGVASAFRQTGTVYLKADWTNRNGEIANLLKSKGRAGVPLYLVYDRHGGEPTILPQLLTEGDVVSALKAAAR